MRVVITGAGGFVGTHLVQHLLATTDWELLLIDTQLPAFSQPRVQTIAGTIASVEVLNTAFARPCDVLYHLAAVPGGSAEQNPALSKSINLDATLSLFEKACAASPGLNIVYASTIAVLGAPLPEVVDDATPVNPVMIYGTHKAMIELALRDLHRRGLTVTCALRLPGIIARPMTRSGLKSAFLSDVLHLLKHGKGFTSPVSEKGHCWLMSVQQCARNLYLAAQLPKDSLPASRVVTLPALRVNMADYVNEIIAQCNATQAMVDWQADEQLEAVFAKQPPLSTPLAEAAGFRADKDLAQLVRRGLRLVP